MIQDLLFLWEPVVLRLLENEVPVKVVSHTLEA